jgi:hypothetical protein
LIAGVRVFNTALTAAQVADLYLNPEKIVPDGVASSALKLWLPMMEGAGTTAYDGSGNGNHGTINGATWVSGIGAPVAQTALVSWNKGTNILTYSEQFDNAAWLKYQCSVSANQTTSPDGTQTADKLTLSGGSGNYTGLIYRSTTPEANSIYMKNDAIGSGKFYIQVDGVGNAAWNVDGTLSSVTGGTAVNGVNMGNGWFRFTYVCTGGTYINYGIQNGTTGSSIFIWGAQVNAGSVQPYIPTLATAQTSPVLLPQGLTANKDITGVNAFESARNPYALNLDGASWAEVHDNASLDITMRMTLRRGFIGMAQSQREFLDVGTWLITKEVTCFIHQRQQGSIFLFQVMGR